MHLIFSLGLRAITNIRHVADKCIGLTEGNTTQIYTKAAHCAPQSGWDTRGRPVVDCKYSNVHNK